MHKYDCVINGGGMVGATLALVLGQLNYRVLMIEHTPAKPLMTAPEDQRTIALSHASCLIFEQLGIWQKLADKTIPIEQVLVTVKGQLGSCWLKAKEEALDCLGSVVSVLELETDLYEALTAYSSVHVWRRASIHSHLQTQGGWQLTIEKSQEQFLVESGLLVAADGVGSKLAQRQGISFRKQVYGHYAVMANVELQIAYPFTAIERFLPQGAIALLPWRNNYATCVWTVDYDPQDLMALTDNDFLHACQQQLGKKVGKLQSVAKRLCFGLQMQLANVQVMRRFLLIGNAAHSLHPIAAQGFNLSLRDIWQLRSQLLKQPDNKIDLGCEDFLAFYLQARRSDQNRVVFMTDKIARFMSGGPLPSSLRALGITLFDCFTPVKRKFTRLGMGL